MTISVPNNKGLRENVSYWLQQELTVYANTHLDLTDRRERVALLNSMTASLTSYLEERGFAHVGITIDLFDDVQTRISYDADAATETTDLVMVTAIAPGHDVVSVTQGGWKTFAFDVDGDGR